MALQGTVSLHSPAAAMRGQLKHSWLENQILNKVPADLLSEHTYGWPALVEEFPQRVIQTRLLAGDIASGFSPAQLVDRLEPLKDLSPSQTSVIKESLHAAYLECVDVDLLSANLMVAAEAFESTLTGLLVEWGRPPSEVSDSVLSDAWSALRKRAWALAARLDELPREIVLP